MVVAGDGVLSRERGIVLDVIMQVQVYCYKGQQIFEASAARQTESSAEKPQTVQIELALLRSGRCQCAGKMEELRERWINVVRSGESLGDDVGSHASSTMRYDSMLSKTMASVFLVDEGGVRTYVCQGIETWARTANLLTIS